RRRAVSPSKELLWSRQRLSDADFYPRYIQSEAPIIMRIGIRLTISALVLASILVSAIGVHILWWRTAEANSHALADTINGQIVSTVEKELTTITTEARA